jgi:hypothetical protein
MAEKRKINGARLKPQAAKQVQRAATPNGRIIQGMLAQHNIDPNLYKDYVAITGDRLIDWSGEEYQVQSENGTAYVGPSAVLHKRHLKKVVGSVLAAKFWHPTLNKRVVRRGPKDPRGQHHR